MSKFSVWLFERWHAFLEWFAPRWNGVDHWIDTRFKDEFARDDKVAHGFKPDATAIEEAPVPISMHIVLYAVLGLLGFFVLWAIFGTIDRIVVAPGKLATRTPLIVMQPFNTSRIQAITVKAGDHVRKGQVLVRFDPAFAQADVASLRRKAMALSVRTARLEAQMAGEANFACPPVSEDDCRIETQIFDQESSTYAAEIAQRDSRAAAVNSQYRASRASIDGLQKQLDTANRVVDIYKGLLEDKAGAPLDVMKAESSRVDIDMRLKSAIGDARKLAEQRLEVDAERRSFVDKWRSDHNQQLVQARNDLGETSETLNKAMRMRDFTELRAPADAVVLEIADRSEGSVLREAETLITLVPDNADLYVEGKVQSRDISYIKVGNKVRVKLESYPFQRYGTMEGVLDVISADSVPLKEDEDRSQVVYLVQVRLTDPPQDLTARGFRLRPGLIATAEIKTGKRSIISYVLNPILRMSDESLREP